MTRSNWHEVEQRTHEWDKFRCGKVTGSAVSTIFARGRDGAESKTRHDYLVKLATERDTGIPLKDFFDNEDMRNGREREPDGRALFEQATSEMVDNSVGFIDHPTIPWFGVSPDGIVLPPELKGLPREGFEIKCPKLSTFAERVLSRRVPSEHKWQCLALMECATLERVWYVNYHPERPAGQQLLVIAVERDEAMIRQMIDGVKLFNEEVEEYRHALARATYF